MHIEESINAMNKSVLDIQSSFENFKLTQEKKMNQIFAAQNRIEHQTTENNISQQKLDFIHFIKKGLYHKGLSSESKSGEYLIPPMIIEEITKKITKMNSFRFLAGVTQITTDVYEILKEEGHSIVGWVSETEDRKETDISDIKKIVIPTHEIYAKPKVSQKILDDSSINIENWVYESIAESMAIFENLAFIKGDGIGKPKGILPYVLDGSIESVKTNKNGVLANADCLIQIVNLLEAAYLDQAYWIMSRSALSVIRGLKDPSTGQYILQPSLLEGMNTTLLGFPVYINEAMDKVTSGVSSTPILFGNFKQGYQIVDRQDMKLLRDPYSSKPFIEFYTTKRVGGDVINKDCIKAIQFTE
jgi:HK97 family phage major capsid protein